MSNDKDFYKKCKDLYLNYKNDCSLAKFPEIDKISLTKLNENESKEKLKELNKSMKYLEKCINKRISHRLNCIHPSERDESHLYWIKKLIRDYKNLKDIQSFLNSKIKTPKIDTTLKKLEKKLETKLKIDDNFIEPKLKIKKKLEKKESIQKKNVYDILSESEDEKENEIEDEIETETESEEEIESEKEGVELKDQIKDQENIDKILDKLIEENEKHVFVPKSELKIQKKLFVFVKINIRDISYNKTFRMNQEDDVNELINLIYAHLYEEQKYIINRDYIKLYYKISGLNNILYEKIPNETLISELNGNITFDEAKIANEFAKTTEKELGPLHYIVPLLYKFDKKLTFDNIVEILPTVKKAYSLLTVLNKLNLVKKDPFRNAEKIEQLTKETEDVYKKLPKLKFEMVLKLLCIYLYTEDPISNLEFGNKYCPHCVKIIKNYSCPI